MRRNALRSSALVLAALTAAGCNQAGKRRETIDPVFGSADSYVPPVPDSTSYGEPYPEYGSPEPVEIAAEPQTTSSKTEPRYHTVVKRDTLYGLARTYYGDQRRWRDIYEANRSTISDPNKIRVGQRLLIP